MRHRSTLHSALRQERRAFTLAELLIVILIVVVVLLVVVLLISGGEHGPGRHTGSGAVSAHSSG